MHNIFLVFIGLLIWAALTQERKTKNVIQHIPYINFISIGTIIYLLPFFKHIIISQIQYWSISYSYVLIF